MTQDQPSPDKIFISKSDLPRPCPFCGNKEHGIQLCETHSDSWHMNCMACGADGPPAESWKDALSLWNGRVRIDRLTNGNN